MDSIGLSPALGLSCLKDLRMENCNLSCLPNEVGNLISLETLDLSANNLPTLPDSICNLTRLKRLTLEGCNLSHLPCEIGRLILLEGLSLAGNSLLTLPDSVCNLACLKFLNLNDCNLSHLPDRIGILSSLEILYLERNNVCSLPNSFSDLASLWKLRLNDCGRLQSLPQLPINLKELDASYCTSLESIPTEFNWRAGLLMSFLGCNMLAKNNVMERIDQSFWEGLGGYATIYLPGDEIPNWFQYQYAGSKLSVVVPPRRILGWSLCIVFRTHGNRRQRHQILIIRDKFTELDQLSTFTRYQGQDQMILLYYPSDYIERDELEIEIIPEDSEETEPWLTVKKCILQPRLGQGRPSRFGDLLSPLTDGSDNTWLSAGYSPTMSQPTIMGYAGGPFCQGWSVDSLSLSLPPVLGLSWLKDLRMDNCNLSYLPNEVGNLISLETLDLGKNKLRTLPDSICNLTRLKKLYLSDCDVSHLPNEIGRLVTLKTLILEGNSLLTLPDSICNLTRLEELNLSECDVSHLPGEIGRLISLKSLNLRQNNLLTLPDSFCNLAFLSDLDLKDCNLSHLPDRIGMLSSLMNLNLERNNVCSLPNSFSDLASLEKVYLSNCGSLQSLPELPASLERLHLNYCGRLQSLPELPVSLRNMDARHCTLLESIPTEFNWQAGLSMLLEGCDMLAKNNFANNVMERIDQSLSEDKKDREWPDASVYERMINISLPGDEVPNCTYRRCLPPSRRTLNFLLFSRKEKTAQQLFLSLDFNAGDSVRNSLLTLPDSICNLTRLEELNLSKCDVSHLPGKIGQLISLERLDLRQNNLLTLPDSFCNLVSLRYLDLEDCNLSHLPDRIGMLSSLVVLFLERNNVCSLPNSFSDLASLVKVFLSNCGSLQSLPELPVRLREMEASHCTLLESIPTEFNWQAGLYMSLEGCDMLAKNNFANNVLENIGQSLSENKKYRV
ncbi:hypothetical protein C3L33_07541, partial [Rhododendron williamsianum]